jgi:glycosyltransferase involved in cell wall biosynthesis
MNVLHLNKHENTGGAAIAVKRLHEGLLDLDINSEMLVERATTGDPTVKSRSRLPNGISSVGRFILDKLITRNTNGFSTGLVPSRVHREICTEEYDIAHLHWLGDGYLDIADIAKIDLPIVWTLHDMWPITGGCHYSSGCSRYETGCGNCPILESSSPSDLSTRIHKRKSLTWSDIDINFVAPSRWMADRALSTSIIDQLKVSVIPNGIDTDRYQPQPDASMINSDSTTILFGAISATSDPRKGYDLLSKALKNLKNPSEYTCVVFGDDNPDLGELNIEVESCGYLSEESLIDLYSDCDVMVVPSREESFGQTVIEALACETPVVAFDATGPRDIIKSKKTGYLAKPYDATDLCAGIEWVTEDTERRERLGRAARKDILERFDIKTTTQQYVELYESILSPA